MPNCEDAVIPMPHNFDNISFLVGDRSVLEQMVEQRALPPFDALVIDFLDALSKRLMRQPSAKPFPDVISFAFWCRKSSVLQMRQTYPDLSSRRGRGIAFHIAPSNVAVNFAYSLVVGLLSGNANIVRVPSRDFMQVSIICEALSDTLREWPAMAPFLCLIRYDRNKSINDTLSAYCQSRLIWGGDDTIGALRQSPLGARGIDIAFANRYSFALIDAANYLTMSDKRAIADRFYNDTFLTDQNACTSPRLVVWLGEDSVTTRARAAFWSEFEQLSQEKYQLQEAVAIKKLGQFCVLSATKAGVKKASDSNNLVYRVQIAALDDSTMGFTEVGGYFLEYLAQDIAEILPVCDERCQTLSVLGVEKENIDAFLRDYRPAGIDRVVAVGKTMDFNLHWDGYDLIYTLSRTVSVSL